MTLSVRIILLGSLITAGLGCIEPPPDPVATGDAGVDNDLNIGPDGSVDAAGGNSPDDGDAATPNGCTGAAEHRFPIATTVTASAQDTRVPVPIQLRDEPSLATVLDPDDVVWFTDTSGAAVPFEVIFTEHEAGSVFAWVDWSLGPSASQLFIHIGIPERRPAAPPAMWSDFAGVWHFDGRAGAMIKDSSPNGNAATSGPAGASIGSGHIGSALALDGNQFIRADDSASLRSNNFAISAWVRPTTLANNAMIVTKVLLNDGDAKRSYGFDIRADGTLAGYGFPSGTAVNHSTFRNDAQMPVVVENEWQHIAYTRRINDVVELFVNGQSVHIQNFNQELAFDEGPLLIGADQNIDGIRGFFEGRLDEVMVVSDFRSPEWVQLSYQAQSDPDFVTLGPAEPISDASCP